MFKVAGAHSLELDSADAARDILKQCREQLGDLKPQAAIMFAGIDHDFELIFKRLNTVYPDIELIGCTTSGELSSVHGHSDDSIVLMAFCSDVLSFKAGIADYNFPFVDQGLAVAMSKAVDSAIADLQQPPALCISTCGVIRPPHTYGISDALAASGDDIIAGLNRGLGETLPKLGGVAGDQLREWTTYQFCNGAVSTNSASFLLIGGPLLYSFGVGKGWTPVGRKERVTKSDKNIVYKIGNETALEFFRHYLGREFGVDNTAPTMDNPLAIFEIDNKDFRLLTGQILDKERGSMGFFSNLAEGTSVQISHVPNRDVIIDATERAIRTSFDEYPGTEPTAALCFPGATRKLLLGSRVEEEYLAFNRNSPDLPMAGFYATMEMAPQKRNRPAEWHSDTFVNLIIGVH
jgi:hypothetical protein